jgi:hypothetical protein
MDLREIDFSTRTLHRSPRLHPALQRSDLAIRESARVLPLKGLEERSRFQPGSRSRCMRTSPQTASNGSSRVRHVWEGRTSPGSFPESRYFRAVFSLIPDFAAATARDFSV